MINRNWALTTAVIALTMLYLLVPACGSNNNQTPQTLPYGAYGAGAGILCQPGQVCQSGVQGTPLLPAPAVTSLDSMGSTATLTFGGTSVAAGQIYSGPVTITGVINMMPGSLCPPGAYQVMGQGSWVSGFGGSVAQVTANLQMTGAIPGMQAAMNILVYPGQDPNVPNLPSQFYMRGQFPMSCNPGAIAL